jgi:hypothetical protein
MPNIQAKVALDKERHPERYCPARRCLWRTGGVLCPRHKHLDPVMQEDPAYIGRERDREIVGGELW